MTLPMRFEDHGVTERPAVTFVEHEGQNGAPAYTMSFVDLQPKPLSYEALLTARLHEPVTVPLDWSNAKLVATYRKLVKELSLYRRRNLNDESMAVYAREHKQIVKAIASGDPEAAGQAMFQHVMNSRARTLEASRRTAAGADAGASAAPEAGPRKPVRKAPATAAAAS